MFKLVFEESSKSSFQKWTSFIFKPDILLDLDSTSFPSKTHLHLINKVYG